MRGLLLTGLKRHARSTVGVALLIFPHGGQHIARRNVRDSMLADQLRARERQDAAQALRDSEIAHRWSDAR